MSLFYPLPLLGEGTPDIEAFSSYLIRLARVHSVSVGQLLAVAIAHYPTSTLDSQKGLFSSRICGLVRPNRTTAAIVDVVERATGVARGSLERATFLCLSEVLSRGVAIYPPRMRWCPACIAESRNRPDATYFKLRWQLSVDEHCTVHRVGIRDRCQSCGGQQDSYAVRDSLRNCIHCSKPLDGLSWSDLANTKQVTTRTDDLFRYICRHGDSRFPAGAPQNAIKELCQEALKFRQQNPMSGLLPKETHWQFVIGDQPMSLGVALRISEALEVPLVDLLQGEIRGTNRQLILDRVAYPKWDLARHRRSTWLRVDQIEEELSRAFDRVAQSKQPSLAAVARAIGVSVGALRYHFPVRVERIVQRFAKLRAQYRRAVVRGTRTAVRGKLQAYARRREAPPSAKRLLKELMAETTLPKNLLRAEIKRQLL